MASKVLVNLSDLVDDVVHSFEFGARAKGLTISLASPVSRVSCFADKSQVRRILINLIGNSIKYTQVGKITVRIESQDENAWSVRITDTGPGFSEEQLKELFIPFTRFDTQGIEGVGLGLTLSKILSELNGGSLQVRLLKE